MVCSRRCIIVTIYVKKMKSKWGLKKQIFSVDWQISASNHRNARGTVATIAESARQNGNKMKHCLYIYFININIKQQNKNVHTYCRYNDEIVPIWVQLIGYALKLLSQYLLKYKWICPITYNILGKCSSNLS